MNPEQPAHGEVKVSVTIPRELFDFLMGVGEIDGTSFGDLNDNLPGRFWWRSLMRACERATPPATDVALREAIGRVQKLADTREAGVQRDARHRGSNPDPAYHRSHATVASVSLIDLQTLLAALSAPTPPDQPQIGDVERVARAISKTVNSWDADGDQWEGYESEARAAIAAMPKGDAGWQDISTAPHACHVMAARFDHDAGEWIYGVVSSPPIYPWTDWQMLPEPPAALRDRRAK